MFIYDFLFYAGNQRAIFLISTEVHMAEVKEDTLVSNRELEGGFLSSVFYALDNLMCIPRHVLRGV